MKYAESTIRKHRKQWLDALESGDYRQVRGVLAKTKQTTGEPRGFCCLGVAASLAKVPSKHIPGGPDVRYRHGVLEFTSAPEFGATTELLPKGAQEWLGLTVDDPFINLPVNHKRNLESDVAGTSLAALNDSRVSFKEIAALVREFGFSPEHDELQQRRTRV